MTEDATGGESGGRGDPQPALRRHHNVTFAILALAALTYSLMQSVLFPALRPLQADLHTSTTAITWVLTSYLLSASIATPILGRLGDMFGKRRLLMVALAALASGLLLDALAGSLALMIAGRTVQGIGGAVIPLAYGIIRDEFPSFAVPSAIAMISSCIGVGGGFGIVLSGTIVAHLSYHWLFWIPLGFVAIAAVGTVLVIPESPVRKPSPVDWLGGVLMASWLLPLLLAISETSRWGWLSSGCIALCALSLALLPAWVVYESRVREPLIDMRMMRHRGVWTTNLSGVLVGFGTFGCFVLVPEFAEVRSSTGYGFGASPTQAGLFLLPATVAMLVFSPVAGRLAGVVGPKVPLILGGGLSSGAFALLALAHADGWEIYVGTALVGAGIGLAMSSMANLIVESVDPDQTSAATGMNAITRMVGNAIGGQVSVAILAASLTVGGMPREWAFTAGFAASAVALAGAALAASAAPGRRGDAPVFDAVPVPARP